MNQHDSTVERQIADAVSEFQNQTIGWMPKSVKVVLSDDILVVTLHEALTRAEIGMARSAVGAARVQEFHRQLFADSSESLRREIERIIGRPVLEATAEIEPTTRSIIHAFTTGTIVQVFLLASNMPVRSRF